MSIVIILIAFLAIYLEFRRISRDLKPARFLKIAMLGYFAIINILALTTTDIYLVKSGILSRAGVICLLVIFLFDKGD